MMHHLSSNNQNVTMSNRQVFVDHRCRRKRRRLSTFLTVTCTSFLVLSLCVGHSISAEDPEFAEPIENITAPASRDIRMACSVKNLGPHKVAWIHFEGSAILTVQTHVITRNPRIKVTHDKHRTWILHIENVQESDAGRYMCQINTETAKTQFGYLHVVVPPNIDDSMSSSDIIVRENSNVSLQCHATGSPTPVVKWRREDGGDLRINKTYSVAEWEGETLELSRISRLDMGAHLCIASNGVPPGVSKRLKISVDFPPMAWIEAQLIGAGVGFTVTLECTTEAHPASLNYWTREDGHMIHDNRKYKSSNQVGSLPYKTHMKLTISDLQPKDFGTYKCVAKNPRFRWSKVKEDYSDVRSFERQNSTKSPSDTEEFGHRNDLSTLEIRLALKSDPKMKVFYIRKHHMLQISQA
ncbi:Lachesin [Folsomia candida]|uniref:Lachesin n=1 Tax=Folsomia candida TaxID=158441 RepID=A0A226F369_FOLCA|nr:Lachesin [Folsomia candida]